MKTTYNSTITCLESFLAIQRWKREGPYPQAVLFSGGARKHRNYNYLAMQNVLRAI